MDVHEIRQNPDGHARFAAYQDELRQVTEPDEFDLLGRVLTDPDRVMARSAVLRHLDRGAADLCRDPAFDPWSQAMAKALVDHPFLAQRLREWSVYRALTLDLPWQPSDLLTSSNWLQLKAAAGPSTEATLLLVEAGRTKRIRNTARRSLDHLGAD
jgi:hypothetical protein